MEEDIRPRTFIELQQQRAGVPAHIWAANRSGYDPHSQKHTKVPGGTPAGPTSRPSSSADTITPLAFEPPAPYCTPVVAGQGTGYWDTVPRPAVPASGPAAPVTAILKEPAVQDFLQSFVVTNCSVEDTNQPSSERHWWDYPTSAGGGTPLLYPCAPEQDPGKCPVSPPVTDFPLVPAAKVSLVVIKKKKRKMEVAFAATPVLTVDAATVTALPTGIDAVLVSKEKETAAAPVFTPRVSALADVSEIETACTVKLKLLGVSTDMPVKKKMKKDKKKMDKKVPDATPESADALSPYELKRLTTMRENAEELAALGLNDGLGLAPKQPQRTGSA